MQYVLKYSVLICWSVLSSLSMSILLSILGCEFMENFDYHIEIHAIWSIDNVLNALTIYINFVFGQQLYKILCHPCHKLTINICDKVVHCKHYRKWNLNIFDCS